MHQNSCQLSAFSYQLETELGQSEFLLPPELGRTRRKMLTTVRRRKAEVVRLKSERNNMKVSHPNLFSYEASSSSSLKVCLSHQPRKSEQRGFAES